MKDWNNKQPPGLPEACNFIKKETLAQVFSSEFYEISKKFSGEFFEFFKNTFFTEHLLKTASGHLFSKLAKEEGAKPVVHRCSSL